MEDILPLGLKNHNTGLASLTTFDFDDRGDINNGGADLLSSLGETVELGGFSGLWYDGEADNGNIKFLTVPDRGPNGDAEGNDRPFLLPNYQARVVAFEVNPDSGEITITGETLLNRGDGTTPITGLPNIPNVDRRAVDASGDPVQNDLAGLENFDVFNLNADLANAENPGENFQVGDFGTESLPAEYLTRRANRGFEGMALDTNNGILYAFIQTPLNNIFIL